MKFLIPLNQVQNVTQPCYCLGSVVYGPYPDDQAVRAAIEHLNLRFIKDAFLVVEGEIVSTAFPHISARAEEGMEV